MKLTKTERKALQEHFGKRQYRVMTNGELHAKKLHAELGVIWVFVGYAGDYLQSAETTQFGIL